MELWKRLTWGILFKSIPWTLCGCQTDLALELTVRFDRYADSFAFAECRRRVRGGR